MRSFLFGCLPVLLLQAIPVFAGSSEGQKSRAIVQATTYDFGTIPQGERVTHKFSIRNGGTAPLTLQLLELSQPGMSARFSPKVDAGEEGRLTVEWNTARVKRDISGEALLRSNDPEQPLIRFTMAGIVQPAVDIQPFAAVFLSAFRGEQPRRTVRVVNNRPQRLDVKGIECTSPFVSASVRPLEPGKTYEITATVKPDAPLGRTQEPIYLITDDATLPRLRITANVLIKPDMWVNPDVIDFGEIKLGQLSAVPSMGQFLAQTVLIKRRQAEFQILSVTTDIPALQIEHSPKERAETFRIDIGLRRDKLNKGDLKGTVRIRTSDPAFPELVVPVRGIVE